jgi:hypothetical protein
MNILLGVVDGLRYNCFGTWVSCHYHESNIKAIFLGSLDQANLSLDEDNAQCNILNGESSTDITDA